LYVYGYDVPEAYAIEKDGNMYYAFFTPDNSPFKGQVELRGLSPGTYHLLDYVNDREMGSIQVVSGKPPTLKTEFKDHLLVEAIPQ
jgi:alpha-galactosidase